MIRVIEPAQPFVAVEEAKRHLRVDHSDDDTLIGGYIAAAIGHIDGYRGWLNRFVGAQLVEVSFDTFGFDRGLRMPLGDVLAIDSIGYVDAAGLDQTLDAAGYGLTGDLIWLRPSQSWPGIASQPGAIRVRYRAGFGKLNGDGDWVNDVPDPIRVGVMMFVAALYEERGDEMEMPRSSQALLSSFRLMGV